MQTTFFKILFIASVFCTLTACSVFGPVKSDPGKTYVLNAKTQPVTSYPSHVSLFVAPMDGDLVYNTTQMAYSTQAYQVAYFANNRWAESPTQMLQPLMVQTLQKTHHFHAVSSMLSLGGFDYILNTQLIELNQLFYAHVSQVHLKVRAQLVSTATNRVIAIKEFSIVENAPQKTPYGGVIAANRATAVFLNQLASFCLQRLK